MKLDWKVNVRKTGWILTAVLLLAACETTQPRKAPDPNNAYDQFFDQLWAKTFGSLGAASSGTDTSKDLSVPSQCRTSQEPYWGIYYFPYAATLEAMSRTTQLVHDHSTLFTQQFDQGVPWKEALENKNWPAAFQNQWNDALKRVPKNKPVFISVAPLNTDRDKLALPAQGSSWPAGLESAAMDDPRVQQAYLNYTRRLVRAFQPDYLNLGQEAGLLAGRRPASWPAFARLYEHTRAALKQEFPNLKIGISFGLHELMDPVIARRVKSTVEASDYIGISFYPYASSFGEKYGYPPLPKGAEAWRVPFQWLKNYTSKPVAICETGYSSTPMDLPKFDLHLTGSPEMQAQYVRELTETAKREHYLFVAWFAVADYDALHQKLMPNDEASKIWMHTGFLDRSLRPKPAFRAWQSAVKCLPDSQGGAA